MTTTTTTTDGPTNPRPRRRLLSARRRAAVIALAAGLGFAGCTPPPPQPNTPPQPVAGGPRAIRPQTDGALRQPAGSGNTTPQGNDGQSLLVNAAPADAAAHPPADAPAHYEIRKASRDGIGKFYMGREIAHVMGHLAAGWLERPEREREEKPQQVIEAMQLKPTDVVADIGAGTGYFTFRMAEAVPEGKVLAVDIQPEMLDLLRRQAEARARNVTPVLGKIDNPNLPDGGVDVVLMVDAYHEFDHPREMMDAIVKSLKVGGKVVLVEYRGEDPMVAIKPLHKMTEAQAKLEMGAVGLEHQRTVGVLPSQHIMVFTKPAPKPAGQPAPPPPPPSGEGAPKTASTAPAPAEMPAEPTADASRQLLGVAPRFSVTKIEESVAYYRDKLGFRVEREEHGFAVVTREGVTIQLIVPEGGNAGPRAGTQFAADCDAYIWATDVNKLHDEFRKRGALIAEPPRPRREILEMDIATPDGGVIRFAQRAAGESVNAKDGD